MQKRLRILLTLLAAMLLPGGIVWAAPPLQGGGTEADPYLISSKADLKALELYVNGTITGSTSTTQAKAGGDPCTGLYFALGADIDMAGDTTYLGLGTTPYGRASATSWMYSGHIDGRGHTIRNLYINGMVFKADGTIDTSVSGSRKYLGFVGNLDSGSVRNLNFDASCSVTGNGAVGMAAGRTAKGATVENCSNAGTVRCYGDYCGGIVGDGNGTSAAPASIRNCFNTGTVYSNYRYAGGIAGGIYYLTVENCVNLGRVDMHSFHSSRDEGKQECGGGISGYHQTTSEVRNCLNAGAVSVSGQYAAGISGRVSSGTKTVLNGNVTLGYVDCPSLNYRGMIAGGIPSTSPVFTANYYDASLWGGMAVATKEHEGCKGLTTQALTAGSALEGLAADYWQFEAGLYPRLKLQAAQTLAAAQTYLLFPDGTDAANFGTEAAISTKGTITATVENEAGSNAFSVQNGKILVGQVKSVCSATAQLVNGTCTLRVPLTKIPVLFSGAGTEADPYIIASRQDLENMAAMTNGATSEHYTGKYFRQTADIDMGMEPFDGIACVQTGANYPERTYWFAGIYDGAGHKISNLNINRVKFDADGKAISYSTGGGSAQNVGLFGSLGDGARIKNLTIASGDIQGYFNVGAFAGYSLDDVQISDCHNFAAVTAYDGTVGGITGISDAASGSLLNIIERCTNSGAILSNSEEAGGIIGYSKSVLTDCINLGTVTIRRFNACLADAIAMEEAGGIAGTNQGNMTYCANFGMVSCDGSKAGGLTGFSSSGNKRGSIVGCYNAATVYAADKTKCGALVGENYKIMNPTEVQSDCVYDSQYSGCLACDNADAGFAAPLSTADLISGEAYLPAAGWNFKAGLYPVNKALAGNAAVQAACASYVLMPEDQTVVDFRRGTLGSAMPLTATVSGTSVISVSGNNIAADASATDIAKAAVTLKAGDYSRLVSLQYLPNVLTGEGTAQSPFLVASAADFLKVSDYMLRGGTSFRGKYFRQTADLDFSGLTFAMAGTDGNFFAGKYDGQNHSVANITTTAAANTEYVSTGLFGGIAQGGTVANLELKGFNMQSNLNGGLLAGTVGGSVSNVSTSADCKIEGVKSTVLFTSAKGENIGGICGIVTASARIENCVNRASVTGYKYVGGITGNSDYVGTAYIGSCSNYGAVLAMSPKETQPPTGGGQPTTTTVEVYAGGIAGQLAGTADKCVNHGSVLADPCKVAGGIVGQLYIRARVQDCENRGQVRARDYTAGGIVGQSGVGTPASRSYIVDCRNYTPVRAINQLGGIAGQLKAYTSVQRCANFADLEPTGQWCGGIAGQVTATVSGYDAFALIEDCYNTGSITGNGYNAGIAGYVTTKGLSVNRCFNTGSMTTTNTMGGPAGIANFTTGPNSVSNCYNAGTITGPRYAGGICGNSSGVTVSNCYNIGKVTCTRDSYLENGVGNIVSTKADNITVSNCYYLNTLQHFTVDDGYTDTKALPAAELFDANLGAAFVRNACTFPMLSTLDTVSAAKAFAAYFRLADGDSFTSLSHSFPVAQLEGLSWSVTGNLRVDGSRIRPAGNGMGVLTATCGAFSRSYEFTSTTGVQGLEDGEEIVSVRRYLPDGTAVADPQPGTIVIEVATTTSGRELRTRRLVR